jgi:hemerythrin-like domain-containing protein
MKSTNFLMQEHKLILRALDVLDAINASAERNRKLDESDTVRLLDFLCWFGDAHHQAKEEAILFPALKRAAAAQKRPVEHMILEHEQERALIEQLQTAVRLGRIPDFVSCANKLSSTLRNHIYKEDQILFEITREVLDAAADDEVAARLDHFETALDKQLIVTTLASLRSLEWKYLRRPA